MEEEVGEGLGIEPIRERGRGGYGGDGGAGGPFELNGEVGEAGGGEEKSLECSRPTGKGYL